VGTLIAFAPNTADRDREQDGKENAPMITQQRDNRGTLQTKKIETLLMANKTTGQMEREKNSRQTTKNPTNGEQRSKATGKST